MGRQAVGGTRVPWGGRIAAGAVALTVAVTGLLASPLPALAQVNTEKLRAKQEKPGIHGFFEGAVTWQTGNTDLFQAGLSGRLAYFHKVHQPFLQGTYNIGRQEGMRFLHNGFLHLRWTAMWHKRVGSEVFTQVEFDDFKLLELRSLAGAGVRVAAVLHEKVSVHVGTGYMFEYENLDGGEMAPDDPHPEETFHHRWTNYVSVAVMIKKWLTLSNILYVQPRFDDFTDLRVLEDLTLTFKVTKILKLDVSFQLAYDSDPPSVVEPLDTKLVTKLRVDF